MGRGIACEASYIIYTASFSACVCIRRNWLLISWGMRSINFLFQLRKKSVRIWIAIQITTELRKNSEGRVCMLTTCSIATGSVEGQTTSSARVSWKHVERKKTCMKNNMDCNTTVIWIATKDSYGLQLLKKHLHQSSSSWLVLPAHVQVRLKPSAESALLGQSGFYQTHRAPLPPDERLPKKCRKESCDK